MIHAQAPARSLSLEKWFIDPQDRPQSQPVVITIFTQNVRPPVRPKTTKSSDNLRDSFQKKNLNFYLRTE